MFSTITFTFGSANRDNQSGTGIILAIIFAIAVTAALEWLIKRRRAPQQVRRPQRP